MKPRQTPDRMQKSAMQRCKGRKVIQKNLDRLRANHKLLLDAERAYSAQSLCSTDMKVSLLWKLEQYQSDYTAVTERVKNSKIRDKLGLLSNIETVAITPQSVLGLLEASLRNDVHVRRALSENCSGAPKKEAVRITTSQPRMISQFNNRDDVEYMSIGHMKIKITN